MTWPKHRPPRPDRSADYASHRMPTPHAIMATPASIAATAPQPAKLSREARMHQNLRDAANGRPCLLRYQSCPCDGTMAIWSHCRHHYAGKGAGIKSHDILGALACPHCDAIYDGNTKRPPALSAADIELAWWRAHAESIIAYARDGVL